MVAIGNLCKPVSLAVKREKLSFSLIDLWVRTMLSSPYKRPSKTLSVWRVFLVFKAGKNNPVAVTEWGKSRKCDQYFLPSPVPFTDLGCLSSTQHTQLKEPNFHGSTIMWKTLLCVDGDVSNLALQDGSPKPPQHFKVWPECRTDRNTRISQLVGLGFFHVLKCHKNGNMQDVSYKLERVLALAMNQFLVLCLLLQFLIALCFPLLFKSLSDADKHSLLCLDTELLCTAPCLKRD